MNVSKKIERLEPSAARLSVTVGKDEVRTAYDLMLREYAKQVQIDGFRKGKVPASIIERKFGEHIKIEAMGKLMDDAVEKALEGETLTPLAYAQPELEGGAPEFKLDEDFSFTVKYDVFPEVKVGDVAGAEVELPQVSVAKADEDRELEEIRERNAIVMDKDEGAKAKKGDIATVSYAELDEAGQVQPGTERQDFVFELGSGYNIYKFDDEVIGMKKGDEKVVDKTFPADFEYPELAGQSRKLRISLQKLKEKKLPALDDDLAQDVSEKFKSLDDLRADIKAKLEKRLEDRLRSMKEKGIIDALLSSSTVQLPLSMVNAELGARMRNLAQRMGIDSEEKLASILASTGKGVDGLMEEWRPEAEKSIRVRLILDKLTSEAGFEPTEDDLKAEYERMAADSGVSVDEVKAEYEKRGMLDYLKDRVKEDRLLAGLAEKVKIKKGKKQAFVDLFKENE